MGNVTCIYLKIITEFQGMFFGSCVFCAPLDRYIGRHIDRPLDRCIGRHIGRVSVDMSTDISVNSRSICRPRCVGRHIDRHIGRTSVDMSTDTRPIRRSICRPRVIVRLSADMSIDRLPTFRRYFTATFPGCLAWNKVIHIASYHYLSTF